MNIIRVGDPHVKVSNISESKSLVDFVAKTALESKVDRIEILGDLFHTHAILRLEVVDFWIWALEKLTKICEVVVLVGNHDLSGDYNSNNSSLSVFALMGWKNLIIVEKPIVLGNIGYVPYTHDTSKFIDHARDLASRGARVLVCHQTIQGSKYESGMYAPDGIPTGEWSDLFIHIISGHIHSEQSFGNVIYPGTARWDTVVDANRRKGIWLYTHAVEKADAGSIGAKRSSEISSGTGPSEAGTILSAEFISTENVCSPIQSISFSEASGNPVIVNWTENSRVVVELVGTSAWCAQQKEILKGKCSITTKITDRQRVVARTPGNSLEHFLKNMFVSTMDKDNLLKVAKEMGIV